MKRATVVISALIHAGVAMALVGAAHETNRRKAISVAVAEAKKKAEPKKPAPPPPPKPVVKRAAPKVVASAAKAAPINAAPRSAPAPRVIAESALSLSNDDEPGGIAVGPPVHAAAAAAAPTKVASAVSSARTKRAREALGEGASAGGEAAAGDAPCTEEPTKPVPVFKTEIEYTAAARSEGIEGKLKLRLIVGADGAVAEVEVMSSVEAALDAAAVAAAKLWRFRPAMLCGKAIAGGTYIFSQRFELTD